MSNFRKFISVSAVAILGVTNLFTPLSYVNAATGYDALSDADLENAELNFTMPDKDVFLYARTMANTYHVRFNGNNSTSGSMSDQDFTYDQEETLNPNEFERLGHTFTKWNTKSNGSGTDYANGASVKNLTGKDGAIVNIYAQWNPNQYNISYDLNKGSGSTTPHSGSSQPTLATYDVPFTVDNPGRVGYEFGGWTITGMDGNQHKVGGKEHTGTTADSVTGTGFNNLTATGGATVYFAARWNANDIEYTVYHKRQALNGSYPADLTVTTTGHGQTDSNVTPGVNSYEGFSSPSPQTHIIDPEGDNEITYQYTRKSYDLILNAGRGVASATATGTQNAIGVTALFGESETGSFLFQEPVELSYVLKDGYGTGTWTGSDANTDSFNMPATGISRTVYAIPTEYKITYYLHSGTITGDPNPTTYTVESDDIILNEPERVFSNFAGWTGTDLTGTGAEYDVTIYSGSTGNRSYTATWTCYTGYNQNTEKTACNPNEDTEYRVKDVLQNLNGVYDIFTGTRYQTGTTNSGTDAKSRSYEGFVVFETGYDTINGDTGHNMTEVHIKYSRLSYSITEDSIDGISVEFSGANDDYSHVPAGKHQYQDTITIKATEAEGYTFKNWTILDSNENDITSQLLANSGEKETTFEMPAKDIIIKANTEADEYEITYILHGGELTGGKTNQTGYTVEDDFTLNEPERDYSVFLGWSGTDIASDYEKPIRINNMVGDRTYEAVWTCYTGYHMSGNNECVNNTYNIEVPNLNGTGHGAADDIVFIYDQTGSLPEAPSQSGYDFVGWTITGMSGGVEHYIGDVVVTSDDTYVYSGTTTEFKNLTVEDGGTVILTAIWSARHDTPFVVYHYGKDLTGDGYHIIGSGAYSGTTDTDARLLDYTGTFEGFTYSGGFVNVDNPTSRPAGAGVTTGNIEKDGSLAIYLYYDRNEHTVYLSGQNVTLSGAGTYKYGANVTVTATPNEGYHFVEWEKKNSKSELGITD